MCLLAPRRGSTTHSDFRKGRLTFAGDLSTSRASKKKRATKVRCTGFDVPGGKWRFYGHSQSHWSSKVRELLTPQQAPAPLEIVSSQGCSGCSRTSQPAEASGFEAPEAAELRAALGLSRFLRLVKSSRPLQRQPISALLLCPDNVSASSI